ncbi:SEL1-like repeat protein [Bacillus sp. NP157]|nr:SEL1-like repeat protein [Bacillus sp. NP157]
MHYLMRVAKATMLVALIFVGTAAHADDTTDHVTDKQLADAKCAIGMEKFLPGDYFYCLGAQSYGLNRFKDAQRFFEQAAGWASKPAQYILGVMALNGDHQPMNRPLAAAWFSLAAERHTPRFTGPNDALKATLKPEEQRRAEAYLDQLKRTYADAVAAPRAEMRYRDGMATLKDKAGASYCMAGSQDFRDLAEGRMPASCPPTEQVVQFVDKQANNVFEDWTGHVTVGPLQVAPSGGVAH